MHRLWRPAARRQPARSRRARAWGDLDRPYPGGRRRVRRATRLRSVLPPGRRAAGSGPVRRRVGFVRPGIARGGSAGRGPGNDAGDRAAQPVRDTFLEHRRRCMSAARRRRLPVGWSASRYLSPERRGERRGRGDSSRRPARGPRPFLGERPRHGRQRSRRLAGGSGCPAGDRLPGRGPVDHRRDLQRSGSGDRRRDRHLASDRSRRLDVRPGEPGLRAPSSRGD